ncbi:hypothetical protein D3C76_1258790 [compost metagenome]
MASRKTWGSITRFPGQRAIRCTHHCTNSSRSTSRKRSASPVPTRSAAATWPRRCGSNTLPCTPPSPHATLKARATLRSTISITRSSGSRVPIPRSGRTRGREPRSSARVHRGPVGARLAGEGGLEYCVDLKGLFAGKPAPTMFCVGVEVWAPRTCRSPACRRRRPWMLR